MPKTKQVVKRAYKFRCYPTKDQEAMFNRTWGCVRLVYNRALFERNKAWYTEQRTINFVETSKMLTAWKREEDTKFLSEVSSVPLQQALRNLQVAYQNFFAKRARHPKFKSKRKSNLSLNYTTYGFRFKDGQLHIAKTSEPLYFVKSREFNMDSASSITISKDAAGRWFVSILCESTVESLPKTNSTVGIDLGVKDLAITSHGEKLNFDKEKIKYKEEQVKKAQRELSRKTVGSANFEKAKLKLARKYAVLTDYRRDQIHKITTDLVERYDTIFIEDLNVAGMSRKSKVGNRKRGLNRGIRNNLLGEFRTLLEYKAQWYGREVVAIDRWFPSSKTCSNCGALKKDLSLSDRIYVCDHCDFVEDREINAAKNIEAAGQAVLACGDSARHSKN